MSSLKPFESHPVGSYTRPKWLIETRDRVESGKGSIDELGFLMDEAVILTVKEQELAGLDYVTDGEQRRRSFFEYITQVVDGYEAKVKRSFSFSSGESYESIPVVARKIQFKGDEYPAARETAFLKEHTTKKVKVPVASASQLAIMYPKDKPIKGYSYDRYVEDIIKLTRGEVKTAAGAGADMIQLDAPEFCFLTDPAFAKQVWATKNTKRDWIDMINESVKGIDATVGLHICYGNYRANHSADGSYEKILPDIYDLDIDVFVLEFASPRHQDEISLLKEYPLSKDKWLAVGAIDVKTPDIEPIWLVKKRLLKAAEFVSPRRLQSTADCGFAPTWDSDLIPRRSCFLKFRSLSKGTREAAKELGIRN